MEAKPAAASAGSDLYVSGIDLPQIARRLFITENSAKEYRVVFAASTARSHVPRRARSTSSAAQSKTVWCRPSNRSSPVLLPPSEPRPNVIKFPGVAGGRSR